METFCQGDVLPWRRFVKETFYHGDVLCGDNLYVHPSDTCVAPSQNICIFFFIDICGRCAPAINNEKFRYLNLVLILLLYGCKLTSFYVNALIENRCSEFSQQIFHRKSQYWEESWYYKFHLFRISLA
jgi:hypothetical protein